MLVFPTSDCVLGGVSAQRQSDTTGEQLWWDEDQLVMDESATIVEGPGSPLVAELIVIGIYYRWWSSCVRLQAVA